MNNNKTPIYDLIDLDEYENYDEQNFNAIKTNDNIKNTAQYLQTERYNYDHIHNKVNDNQNITTSNNMTSYSPITELYPPNQSNSDEIANYIAESYKLAEYLKKHDKEAYKIASRFYYCDNTFLIIAVIILSITTLLLIKRVVKL
tara:strand:- start:785 stop:1219 length:435 start_codon:yes stop_codon:yes gene_type:complete